MEARAKLLGHPLHQMLIVFPLGLLGGSIIFDIAYLVRREGHWGDIAFWMIVVGVISGLVAAVFGLIDWLAIPGGTRAKRIGLLHGVGNVVVVALFIGSWLLRRSAPTAPPTTAIVLSFVGVAFTAWLTYLELFVIEAICKYCVTSAVIVTAIFIVSVADVAMGNRVQPGD